MACFIIWPGEYYVRHYSRQKKLLENNDISDESYMKRIIKPSN